MTARQSDKILCTSDNQYYSMFMDEQFWREAREQMLLDTGSINFNAGTLSPTPKTVFEAVTNLRRRQADSPSDFHWRQVQPLLARSRGRLAQYLNVAPNDLVLLPNVTYAINIVMESLRLPAGSEILTTDHEYGAMLFCLQRYAKQHNCTVRAVKLPYRAKDPQEIVDAVAAGFTLNTRLLFFSHCTTTTGLILPARGLTELARQKGDALVLIDGAHAPGMIPLDLAEIGADFYGANCHKWMMAPCGSGFLHVAPQRKPMVESMITSWGWDYDHAKRDEDSGWGGTFWHRELEFHGTLDRTPQMVIADALDFRDSLGGDRPIESRYRQLTDYARKKLTDIGLTCVNPLDPRLTGCLLAFEFPCDDPIRIRDLMWFEHHIECPVTVTDAGGKFLRVSCAWFNTFDEVDRLAAAVRRVLDVPGP